MILQVVEDAAAEYLAYFADKTIGMIRAPDEFTYPAPFNLIELVLIAPFEYVLPLSQPSIHTLCSRESILTADTS